MPAIPDKPPFEATKITRPAPVLLTYYLLLSVPTLLVEIGQLFGEGVCDF